MRRMRQSVDRAWLPVWERIIETYCPYVLVRCCRYTQGRRQAQQIGTYTLVTACLAVREMGGALPPGRIVEIMLRVVGPDVRAGARGEDWRQGPDEPLFAEPWMQYTAMALNALKRRGRELLVLHYLGGLEPEELVRLLEQPARQVRARLERAEGRLARWLGTADVPGVLTRFAAGLDEGWMQEVTDTALEYLAATIAKEDF